MTFNFIKSWQPIKRFYMVKVKRKHTVNNILLTWRGLTPARIKSGVRSGVVVCSCERSSSSHCPGFERAAAWMAGDPIPVWTTLAHLFKGNTFLNIHCIFAHHHSALIIQWCYKHHTLNNSPFNVISKAPVDINWFSIILLRKNTIIQAYIWKGGEEFLDQ